MFQIFDPYFNIFLLLRYLTTNLHRLLPWFSALAPPFLPFPLGFRGPEHTSWYILRIESTRFELGSTHSNYSIHMAWRGPTVDRNFLWGIFAK